MVYINKCCIQNRLLQLIPLLSTARFVFVIFGDYKLTVNKVVNADEYLVPKTEDLLVKMNAGRIFCKLDLSNAYQQLVLDKKGRRIPNYKYAQRTLPTNEVTICSSFPWWYFSERNGKNALVTYHIWLFELMIFFL